MTMHTSDQRRRHQKIPASKAFVITVLAFIFTIQHTTNAFLTPSTTLIKNLPASRQRVVAAKSSIRTLGLSMVAKSGGRMIVTTEQFVSEVLLSSDGSDAKVEMSLPVLVLFSAPWCGPCRLTNPVVKEVMKQYQSKIEVVEISTDDLPDVAANAGVSSIPTIQLYHDGKVKDTIVGCVAKNVLARAVDKVLEDLGMLDEQQEED